MKNKLLLTIVCCSFIFYANSQNGAIDSNSVRIAELEKKIISLTNLHSKYDDLLAHNKKINKSKFETLYFNIRRGVELQDEIGNIYNKVDKQIKKDKVDNTLNSINNPTSNVLGFRFSDVIINSANNIFDKKEFKDIDKKKKNKFMSVVKKIVDNPIVSSISSSFPLTGTIRSIITSAATFFSEPNVEMKFSKWKGKVTGGRAEVIPDTGFSNKFVKAYANELLPYINFYESLENANLDFDLAISDLKRRNKNLGDLIRNTDSLLTVSLGLPKGTDLTTKQDRVANAFKFSESGNEGFDFVSIIERDGIRKANNVSKQIGMLALSLSNYYSEYIQIQKAKYNKYISTLKDAKKQLPMNKDEKERINQAIDSVIKEIEELVKDDTLNIYKTEFSNIKRLREQLIY